MEITVPRISRLRLSEKREMVPNMNKTILEIVVGSTAHGTAVLDGLEDLDLMSVVVEDLPTYGGFTPKDTWVERTKPVGVRSEAGDIDRSVYGLRKFLSLALKGNPSILIGFFVTKPEFIKQRDMIGYTLQTLATRVVSKQVYQPFRGYMRQQHERLLGLRGQRNITRPELVDAYGYDTKYASYIVRLGLQGEEMLLTGKMTLPMPEAQRNLVRAVREGKYKFHEISELIIQAENQVVQAYEKSTLPEKPDHKFMENWMLNVYLYHWKTDETTTAEEDK